MMMEGDSNGPKTRLLKFDYGSDSDDSLSDIECDLCSKSFSSVGSYEQHLKSKKHYQMLTNEKAKKNMEKLAEQNDSLLVSPSNDDDDSSETLACKICSKSFSGYVPYASHIKSNIHKKNLQKEKLKEDMKDLPEVLKSDDHGASDEDDVLGKPYARCTPCKKTFYDPNSYSLHVKGIQHQKKINSQKVLESLKLEENGSGEVNDDEQFLRCHVCQKEFSGPIPFKTHLKGTYHQRELQRSKAEEELKDSFTRDPESQKLVCKECNKGFTDAIALKAHLANNNHEKQKSKEKMFSFVSSNPEIVAAKTVQNLTDDESDAENNYRHGAYFFVCKLCKCSFTGPESVRAHLESKKHVQAKNEKDQRRKMKSEKEKRSDQENTSSSVNSVKDKKSSEKLNIRDDFELI